MPNPTTPKPATAHPATPPPPPADVRLARAGRTMAMTGDVACSGISARHPLRDMPIRLGPADADLTDLAVW